MRRILIADSVINVKKCCFQLPWRYDSSCFRFRVPKECISASDIDKIVEKDNIESLVIKCDLDSYDFIADMLNLKYLYIYNGANVKNLNFTEKLVKLQQLYIANTHISDLSPLYSLMKKKEQLIMNEPEFLKKLDYITDGICIDTDCKIAGAHTLFDTNTYIAELIIGRKTIKRRSEKNDFLHS